jgi:uroporphyrinogen-III synthase
VNDGANDSVSDGVTPTPLAGRHVVVTRAADQADGLVEALQALGAQVIRLPLIDIVDAPDGGRALAEALERLDSVDWLVVTSPNGAQRVAGVLADRPPGRPHVAAVGRATEEALGRAADLVPADQIAEGLLAEFPRGEGRVLLIQPDSARPVLAEGLTARGWRVLPVVAYRTAVAPESLTTDAAWRDARDAAVVADAVVFTSGSTVRGWANAVGPSTPPVVVAIGPATAAVAAELGLSVTAVASDHSTGGLLSALADAIVGPPMGH